MKPCTVYIEREGRQFGLEMRVRIKRKMSALAQVEDPELRPQLNAAAWTFPVLRTRLWALRQGFGWPPVQ